MRTGISNRRSLGLWLIVCGLAVASAMIQTQARPRSSAVPALPQASDVQVGPDNIGGVVSSSKGPEAGVWVIAETTDLGTKFRKIVVTDDQGRYLIPELRKANYKVWVRGYGLVDSQPVVATTGQTLALAAVIAPDARAAAQYYPGNYWYSLMKIPPKSAFPMKIPPPPAEDNVDRFADCRQAAAKCQQNPGRETIPGLSEEEVQTGQEVSNQAEYLYNVKRVCEACHQMGNKATREVLPSLGTFKNSSLAWERVLKSGQTGGRMLGVVDARLGHDTGLAMFADWGDRIAAGEVPPAPPRPQGIERDVVLSIWDFASDRAFVHDVVASNQWKPTVNANGPIYGGDLSAGTLEYVDPIEYTKGNMPAPMTRPEDRARMRPWSWPMNEAPSPYWGDELVWNDPISASGPVMDTKGRVWYHALVQKDIPDFCKAGSNNKFAKNFPFKSPSSAGLVVYDPKTGQQTPMAICAGGHSVFAGDKDDTIYMGMGLTSGGIAWFNTHVWDETHDAEKAYGWCPGILDYNGDGKIGPYTTVDQPADPKLDRLVNGAQAYGVGVNPVDGSFWAAAGVNGGPKTSVPGKILRYTIGSNPPETCRTELYEPPFNNPKAPGMEGFNPQGVEVDSKGIAWAGLGGSAQLARFDRSKCKVLNGPTATGQHCPEGWTLYQVPGPTFKGTNVGADQFYLSWVDRENTLGLGKDIPVIDGTGSDSLIAFLPDQKKFVTLRVPYPMDLYTRSMTGRIDDPKTGWKGRGIWAGNNERVVWHIEGGKGTTSQVVHFQVRPDPLAR
jgi:hypothetical protein